MHTTVLTYGGRRHVILEYSFIFGGEHAAHGTRLSRETYIAVCVCVCVVYRSFMGSAGALTSLSAFVLRGDTFEEIVCTNATDDAVVGLEACGLEKTGCRQIKAATVS